MDESKTNVKKISLKSTTLETLLIGKMDSLQMKRIISSTESYSCKFSCSFKGGLDEDKLYRTPMLQPIPEFPEEKWCIQLSDFHGITSFEIKRLSPKTDNLIVAFEASFETTNGEIWHKEFGTFVSIIEPDLIPGEWYTAYVNMVKSESIEFPDDILILKVDMTISGFTVPQNITKIQVSSDVMIAQSGLIENLKTMYMNRSGDITITIRLNSGELKAHKFILTSRSQVFARMFKNDMIEKHSNQIIVDDFDLPAFDAFLRFLYTGEIADKSLDMVLSLYSAAVKYEVPSLQKICSPLLISHLEVSTVCRVLKFSDLYTDADMKEAAIGFLSQCFNVVAASDEWANLIKEFPKLASDVFAHFTMSSVLK